MILISSLPFVTSDVQETIDLRRPVFVHAGLLSLVWDSFDYMEIIIHMSCLVIYADGVWGQNKESNVQLGPRV